MNQLRSFSLTHVQYDPTRQPLSKIFALITLTPIFLAVSYCTAVVMRREVAGILMLVGQLANEGVNICLKRYIKEPRPFDGLGKGYGMPSSHSQFMGYFFLFSTLYLFSRITLESQGWKFALSFSIFILSCAVSYSRVYLGYHTELQVVVGFMVGCTFAIFWFFLVERYFRPLVVDHVVPSWIGEWFRLRDNSHIPNILKVEYELSTRSNPMESSKSK